jgi:nitroreductase
MEVKMDCLEAIKTRRSIRKFKTEPVPEEILEQILEAAMFAPSAGNEQPWQFVVLDQREMLDEAARINPNAAMAKKAPLAVMVCGDLSLEKHPGNWALECSASTQNLLLAAHALGLGAVWTGILAKKDRVAAFQKLCKLPDNVIPLGLMVMGYPDQTPAQPQRYLPERVHRNRFGKSWA